MIEVVSFGFGHAPAPRAELVVDLRAHFRDPHVRREMRELTGLDDEVRHTVIRTPGIPPLIDALAGVVNGFLVGSTVLPTRVAVGCTGGRHRSVVVAVEVARRVRKARGVDIRVRHRDIERPVLAR
ncbi:RapZ C-terminal domain-containing protein [Streptomyces reniochalinae]|uniref:RapZ C-terminal domain-containing protein n=1 Tax=Streptomyces reniochalinae TaxID=2250578 RepID=UPI001FE24BEB|nr:RNase adapter RapZ [Streptomyces reniochalinae]